MSKGIPFKDIEGKAFSEEDKRQIERSAYHLRASLLKEVDDHLFPGYVAMAILLVQVIALAILVQVGLIEELSPIHLAWASIIFINLVVGFYYLNRPMKRQP